MPAFRFASVAAASLLAVAAATATALAAAETPVQHVEVHSFSYSPAPIHLKAGQEVTLHFMNDSSSSHDFTSKHLFESAKIVSGKADKGSVEIPSKGTAAITLIPVAGTYKVHCSHTMHKQMGMATEIIVE